MRTHVAVFAILLGVAAAGCARRVVLDPEAAAEKNGKDWIVKSEPKPAGAQKTPAAQREAPRKR